MWVAFALQKLLTYFQPKKKKKKKKQKQKKKNKKNKKKTAYLRITQCKF